MVYIEDEVAACFECKCTTCTICKSRSHTGDCPNDTATQQLLAIAHTNGWKRCRSCKRMIELDHGCNHMTLVSPISPRSFPHQLSKFVLTNVYNSCCCGGEFCYECGAPWKTCRCDRWNEGHLVARAHQLVDREQNPPIIANPPPVLHDAREAAVLTATPRATTPDIDEDAFFFTPPTTPSTIRDLETDITITQSAIDGKVPDDDELPASIEVSEPANHEKTYRDRLVTRPRQHYYRCFHRRWTNVNVPCKKCFSQR